MSAVVLRHQNASRSWHSRWSSSVTVVHLHLADRLTCLDGTKTRLKSLSYGPCFSVQANRVKNPLVSSSECLASMACHLFPPRPLFQGMWSWLFDLPGLSLDPSIVIFAVRILDRRLIPRKSKASNAWAWAWAWHVCPLVGNTIPGGVSWTGAPDAGGARGNGLDGRAAARGY